MLAFGALCGCDNSKLQSYVLEKGGWCDLEHLITIMKANPKSCNSLMAKPNRWLMIALLAIILWPSHAHASIFKGEALDKVANVLTWVVLIVAPIVAIAVFLLIHI